MSEPTYELPQRSWLARLFEAPSIDRMAPATALLVYLALLLWSLFVIFPIYWVVITSVKTPAAVNGGPFFLPFIDFQPSLHAWNDLLVRNFNETLRAFINSLLVAVAATGLCVSAGAMAAYALAKIEYRPRLGIILLFVVAVIGAALAVGIYAVDWWLAAGAAFGLFVLLAKALGRRFTTRLGNNDILFWIISQRILPPIVVVVPIYMMFQSVKLLDTHLGMILAYATVNLPIAVWLMHDFFVAVPGEMEESAQLDGASRLYIFWDIVLPLTRTGLAATTLLVIILCWNEYLLAIFLSTSNVQTMPILVAAMNAGDRGILWWTMCVVIVVMIVPVIIMATLLQRFIARGVLTGALKG